MPHIVWSAELWASLLTVTGVWALTVVSPGPNFLATAHAAARGSRRQGLLVVAGIALGTTIWSAGSLLGLGLLFRSVGWLYDVVRLVGGAYLVFTGVRMIMASRRRAAGLTATPTAAIDKAQDRRAFRRGLLVDLSNPKAAAFFTSLFAVAVPPNAPTGFLIAVVTAVVVIAAGWYAIVACAMATARVTALYRRAERWVTYLTGGAFVGIGAKLAAEH